MREKTEGLPDSSYVYMGFEEGWRWSYLTEFLRLYRYLRNHRRELDLVHFYTTNLILFGPIVAWFAGVRSMATLTGLGRVFTSNNFMIILLRWVYLLFFGISVRLSWRYLFQNRTDLKMLSLKYPRQAYKFVFAGSAVDIPQIRQKDFGVPRLKVVLVARLMPDKGILDFIHVAEALCGTSWEFVLIGPSSIGFDQLYQKVIECDARGILSYKGACSSQDVMNELAHAHILYFPSCGEGLARVMLESGFNLLCPVVYDISGNRDLVAEGRGFMVPVGDVNSVVSVLKKLASDRGLIYSNACSYQSHVVTNYNIKLFSERMDSLLSELITEPA